MPSTIGELTFQLRQKEQEVLRLSKEKYDLKQMIRKLERDVADHEQAYDLLSREYETSNRYR